MALSGADAARSACTITLTLNPPLLDNLSFDRCRAGLPSFLSVQVLELRHGVMMVGPSGSGKTSAWRCLLAALEMLDGVKGEAHIIDPKAIG